MTEKEQIMSFFKEKNFCDVFDHNPFILIFYGVTRSSLSFEVTEDSICLRYFKKGFKRAKKVVISKTINKDILQKIYENYLA